MKRILILIALVALPIQSAIGAYYQSQVTPYITAAAVIIIIILSCLDKIKKYQAHIILSLSVSLLLGTSMIGSYIIGNDLHSEMWVVNRALEKGWDISYVNNNNTSIALGLISPALAKIGFDPIWQFKLMYPLIFSFAPVLLYIGFKNVVKEKYAFLGTMVIIIMPMFTLDMTGHVKGMMAQTFLALLIMILLNDKIRLRYRVLWSVIAVIGIVLNHYSVNAMTVVLLGITCGVGIVLWYVKWALKQNRIIPYKLNFKPTHSAIIVFISAILIVGGMASWYTITAQAGVLKTFQTVAVNITDPITRQEYYDKRTEPVEVTGTYLDKQEQSIRVALGLDFMQANTEGKAFRIVQFLTQLAIVTGIIVILIKRRNEEQTYSSLLLASGLFLLLVVFWPYLATVTSATRFYQFVLFIIAPAFVIGLFTILRIKWLVAIVMSIYALFTLGIVFEVTQQDDISQVNMPYSLALSNSRLNINGAFTETDIEVRDILKQLWKEENISIRTDYNGYQFLIEQIPQNVSTVVEPKKDYYFFVTEWSTEHDKLIYARPPGRRYNKSIEEMIPLCCSEVVINHGNTRVYFVDIE